MPLLLGVAMLLVATGALRAAGDRPPPTPRPTTGPGSAAQKAWMRLIPSGKFAPTPPEPRPKLPEKVERAFVIPITAPITSTLAEAMQRKVSACKGRDAQLVIFEIDSPGGELGAMERIVGMIRDDLADVRTVAWVHREAFSAAAIISLACDEIVMSRGATLGDAMPIMVSPQGGLQKIPGKERGKIESAMRSDIRVLAEAGGYNVALCEAMITITLEVWLVRERATGALLIVEADDYRHRVATDEAPDRPFRKLATIDDTDELVTMTTSEAVRLGFAEHMLDDMAALREHYTITVEPTVLADTWSERLVAILTSPAVTSILLMAGIFFVYAELQAPGFGVAGGAAILCFAVLFGSRYLIGLAAWWEIGLFIVGLVLIGVEVFVIPGFGVAGISGLICCVVGLVAMAVANAPAELPIPSTDLDWSLFERGALALGAGFVLGIIAMFLGARWLLRVPGARPLVLSPPAAQESMPPVVEDSPMQRVQVGDAGTVSSPCRPVGKVRFGDDLLDASVEGRFVEPGATVRVLRRDGNRLIVEPDDEETT
ncbi:MAG: NfeD family protein [Planctomycetota bacterium]